MTMVAAARVARARGRGRFRGGKDGRASANNLLGCTCTENEPQQIFFGGRINEKTSDLVSEREIVDSSQSPPEI